MTDKMLGDRYKLDRRIGSGGMATVYSGFDIVLRRRVAIKVLRPQFAEDDDFVKRFYSEAQHAAKLSHPNVVNVYDVGRQDETYFIVMELVDGATLAEMIESDGRLPEPVAIDFATQLCAGLAYAHRQGILHRDIKPANILITKDDVVKISDFGIARAVTTQTVTMTQPGLVMGSVFYLSPEQAQGHELHATSDLYSLGVVLFQMLSGQLPYTGESPVTVALKHVSHPIPPLDAGDGAPLSPALTAIVRRLLQKDPAARFQSATEVAAALREARERPLSTPYDSPPEELAAGAATAAFERVSVAPKPRPSRFPDRAAPRESGVEPVVAVERAAPRRPARWTAPLAIAAALALAVLGGYAFVNRSNAAFGPPKPVTVGNFVGRSATQVEAALAAAGLGYNAIPVTSETLAKDIVVRQDPAASSKIAPRGIVQLYVSSGLPIVELLDLRQYSLDDAQRYLHNAKLVPKLAQLYDDTVPKGTVISQSPLARTQLPIRSGVRLVVSRGPHPVYVPDLVSHNMADATLLAAARHLKLEVGERVASDNIAPDIIASQNPPAGTALDPGSTVSVAISTGAPGLDVPDVSGKNVADAIALLQQSKLTTRTAYVVDPSAAGGSILEQNPAAGAHARKGALVTLSVAVAGVVPDLAGMSLDQARTALQNAGYTAGTISTDLGAGDATGKVAASEPAAGQPLRPGSPVNLHVNGAPPQ